MGKREVKEEKRKEKGKEEKLHEKITKGLFFAISHKSETCKPLFSVRIVIWVSRSLSTDLDR